MPIYVYECKECKHTEERLEPMSKVPEPCKCPECEKKSLERVVASALVQFGKGFYADGYTND